MTRQAILLPGGVRRPVKTYDALLAVLPADFDARAKELEVYAAPGPPPCSSPRHGLGRQFGRLGSVEWICVE